MSEESEQVRPVEPSAQNGGAEATGGSTSDTDGMPRWVKAFLLVGALLVAALVVAKLTGAGGDHGPGLHTGGGDEPAAEMDGDDHQPMDHTP